jgi:uncharacterized membrane protein
MPNLTIATGGLLIVLGVASYLGTGRTSVTALIPAFFGLPLLIAGAVALKPAARKHAMHAAAMLGVLGLVGAGGRAVPALMRGGAELGTAVWMQLAMAGICLFFVVACVRSFIQARKDRAVVSD